MNKDWLCATCMARHVGFCGALLGQQSQATHLDEKPSWQQYQGIRAGENVVFRRGSSDDICLLCDGWAFRFLDLLDGRRQILNFLLPGDLFLSKSVFRETLNFSVQALTEIRVSRFKRGAVEARIAADTAIVEVVGNCCVAEIQSMDRSLAVIGRGTAEERIAFLLLHLTTRLSQRSVIRNQRYYFPLRQQHIADATGLTPIHVSRVMSRFRDRGLIEQSGGFLTILNPAELERIGVLI
jgi:CRP/FNR family transcriptional regulator